jgi:8-oxo-dGTP pyrophosphatase MutT (NUDIX family)
MIPKKLAQSLKAHRPQSLPLEDFRSSAVLVPLIQMPRGFSVVYTQRSDRVRDHKNQISFPGGVREKQDRNLLKTALRESREEIGLQPENVCILGRLRDLYTPTGYRITPYVGCITAPVPFKANPHEIREILQVPLKHLLNSRNQRWQRAEFYGPRFDLPFYQFGNHMIWGATGRITYELMALIHRNLKAA